jgi:hypothetical protein
VICGIATGTGVGKRELYSNAEESIIEALNPVVINGIEGLLTRGDLADRSLTVMLTEIGDDKRRDEAEIEEEIARVAPGVLALLFDGLVEAMRMLPTLKLPRMPRMADFARLACAAAPAFGWTAKEMLAALEDNRRLSVEAVIAADAVATAVLDLVHKQSPNSDGWYWTGSSTELFEALKNLVPVDTAKSKAWPKTPHHLSGRLRRAAPALRRAGFELVAWREAKRGDRKIGIRPTPTQGEDKQNSASAASAASAAADFNGLDADALTLRQPKRQPSVSRAPKRTTTSTGSPKLTLSVSQRQPKRQPRAPIKPLIKLRNIITPTLQTLLTLNCTHLSPLRRKMTTTMTTRSGYERRSPRPRPVLWHQRHDRQRRACCPTGLEAHARTALRPPRRKTRTARAAADRIRRRFV